MAGYGAYVPSEFYCPPFDGVNYGESPAADELYEVFEDLDARSAVICIVYWVRVLDLYTRLVERAGKSL